MLQSNGVRVKTRSKKCGQYEISGPTSFYSDPIRFRFGPHSLRESVRRSNKTAIASLEIEFLSSRPPSFSLTGYANQVTCVNDHASFEIAIVDAESMDTVCIGELNTRGAGLMFVGTKSTAKSLVKGLIKEWDSAGHPHR